MYCQLHFVVLYGQALDTDQILPLHVDTGFMRKNESKQVKESLKLIGMDLKGTFVCTIVLILA